MPNPDYARAGPPARSPDQAKIAFSGGHIGMDFGLNEDLELFQRAARAFLRAECPPERARSMERRPEGYDPELYARMAALGWTGLRVPEALGGSEGSWLQAALLYEELGRALCPSPLFESAILAASALLAWGSSALQAEWLPGVATGEVVLVCGSAEAPAPAWEEGGAAAVVARGGRLRGTERFVPFGQAADAFLIPARGEAATGIYLVRRSDPAVAVTALETMSAPPLAVVELEGAAGEPLTEALDPGAWPRLRHRAGTLLAAEMVGGAQAALDMAIAYAGQREAFGRQIGTFQAIQHKLAEMALRLEAARVAVYYAAHALDEGRPALAESAVAQLQAGEAYGYAAAEGVQVFGGVGLMDDSPISSHFRRAKSLELRRGPAPTLQEWIVRDLESGAFDLGGLELF
jgi:alkylation response protein AidB-like acyl-CoA dehydrogenase